MCYSRQPVTDALAGVADRIPSPAVSRGLTIHLLSCAADVFGGGRNPPPVPLLNILRRCNMAPQEVCPAPR